MDKEKIFESIYKELERQDVKWGKDRVLDDLIWLSILAEEFGEVSKEVVELNYNKNDKKDLKKELIQVAAVCVQFINSIELSKEE